VNKDDIIHPNTWYPAYSREEAVSVLCRTLLIRRETADDLLDQAGVTRFATWILYAKVCEEGDCRWRVFARDIFDCEILVTEAFFNEKHSK
jgi:hypothetical protein